MDNSTKIFKALSDPNRLRILKAVQSRTLCVCEIRALLELANSTVSQHLSILKEVGFIVEEKDGRWVNYSINPHPTDMRVSSIISTLDFWVGNVEIIKTDKQKMCNIDRKTICC